MNEHQALWFLLSCFLPIVLMVCDETCPPAEEGKPFTLYCSGGFAKDFGQVFWVSNTTEDSSVAHCNTTTCIVKDKDRYSASIVKHKAGFDSKLKIHKVTYRERGVVFTCMLYNPMEKYKVMCCSMRTYVTPASQAVPKCQIVLAWGNQLNLSCQIVVTYPGITSYIIEIFQAIQLQDKLKCEEKYPIWNYSHYETNCSATISVWSPGSYRFAVMTSPDLDGFSINSGKNIFVLTKTVHIRAKSSVRMQLPEIRLCKPSKKSVVIICNSAWFPSQPRFRWYVDNLFVGDGTTISTNQTWQTHGSDRFYFSKSTYSYETTHLGMGSVKHVKCEAIYTNISIGEEISVSDGSDINIFWPPVNPPVFIDNRGNILGPTYVIDQSNRTVSCVVDGGKPPVFSIKIECWDSDRTEKLVELASYTGLVNTLDLKDILSSNSCTCSADHITGCYNSTTSITFLMKSKDPPFAKSTSDNFSVLYYMLAVITAGLVLVFIIPAFVYIIHGQYKTFQRHITSSNDCQHARRKRPSQFYKSIGSLDSLPLQPDLDTEDQNDGFDNEIGHISKFNHLKRPPIHRPTPAQGSFVFENQPPIFVLNPLEAENECNPLKPDPSRPKPCRPNSRTTHVQVPYKYKPEEKEVDVVEYGTILGDLGQSCS